MVPRTACRRSTFPVYISFGEEEREMSRENIILSASVKVFATAVVTFFADGRGVWRPLGRLQLDATSV